MFSSLPTCWATKTLSKRATENAIEERRNPAYVTARATADQYRKLLTAAGVQVEAERTAVFERELEEWLSDMEADPTNRAAVRTMIEAGLETDASGLHRAVPARH